MAAYAGLVSLSKVIDLSLSQKQEYVLPYSREQMMSLREELGLLQDLLEHLSGRSHISIDVLEIRIRDVSTDWRISLKVTYPGPCPKTLKIYLQ